MALKLPIPSLDKRSLALAKARFGAWWNGAEFDEAAAMAGIGDAANDAGIESELFAAPEASTDPRLAALERLWGKGRIAPGDAAAEAAAPQAAQLSASGALAVFGPGLWGPVAPLASAHPGEICVFEWREETRDSLKAALGASGLDKRVTLSAIDMETFAAPSEAFDALVGFDAFTYVDNAARLAIQFARLLRPHAHAVLETYCAVDPAPCAPAFASAFSEPHLRAPDAIAALLDEAGLRVERSEDVTEEHIETARAGFRQLAGALKERAALASLAAKELAWETVSWRTRFELLASRKLERRRLYASRA